MGSRISKNIHTTFMDTSEKPKVVIQAKNQDFCLECDTLVLRALKQKALKLRHFVHEIRGRRKYQASRSQIYIS